MLLDILVPKIAAKGYGTEYITVGIHEQSMEKICDKVDERLFDKRGKYFWHVYDVTRFKGLDVTEDYPTMRTIDAIDKLERGEYWSCRAEFTIENRILELERIDILEICEVDDSIMSFQGESILPKDFKTPVHIVRRLGLGKNF